MLVRHCFMFMLMIVDILAVNVDMGMYMGVLMGMDFITMGMFVSMRVYMLVGMLQLDGVLNHKICAYNHYN